MAASNSSVSHQEYLKKYMSGAIGKKKTRKVLKKTSSIKRSKIIDDDVDVNNMRPLEDGEVELYQMDDDAPQIAGIIDERPPELKAQEYYNAKRWKVFGGEDGVSVTDNMDVSKKLTEADKKPTSKTNLRESKNKTMRQNSDSDMSPIRTNGNDKVMNKTKRARTPDSDFSPPRNNTVCSDSDASPPRRDTVKKTSREETKTSQKKERRKTDKGDFSVPKTSKNEMQKTEKLSSSSTKYEHKSRHQDSDNTPPRVKDHRKLDKDQQNERKSRNYSSSDESPPRRIKFTKKSVVSRRSRSASPSRKQGSSFHYKTDRSEKQSRDSFRKELKNKHSSDSDNSPPRKSKLSRHGRSSSDLSPPRNSSRDDKPRHGRSSSDLSPPRNSSRDDKPKKKILYKPQDGFSSDEDSRSRNRKMEKTLDGKRAGLQDSKALKQELLNMKKREDEIFSKLDAKVSGVGAAAIKRDRKTGQIRDLEKEKEAQKEKEAKASVVNEKYSKWGRGLKQVEDAATRAAEALKVMNKPLARYADDKDLDDFLKAQDREGDPMLDYIKQKQREATPLVGEKPIYKGSYNPNRFGIRPGHRWDGVVRSSGYEKEWFTHQNAKKAVGEEAYKWSTSDM